MPYKRERSPYYYVRRRRLPGFGDTGRLSSGVKSKRVAERMERALEDVAERALVEPSYREVLEAVVERRLDLPDFLAAYTRGDLDRLRVRLSDPPLSAAIDGYVAAHPPGRGVRIGVDLLRSLAPPKARLSFLRDPRSIVRLCAAAEAGEPADEEGRRRPRKRNSVRRTLLRAISLLLRHELGRAERDRVFADVRYSGTDDTREVLLSPAEITRLLEAADPRGELGTVVRLALATGADRGVLLAGRSAAGTAPGLLVRQVSIWATGPEGEEAYRGEVYLKDRKADKRPRTVPITDALCRELLPRCAGKGPDEPVFSMTYPQLDYHWRQAREAAGLPDLRFKDLRAQWSIYAEKAGIPLTVASRAMGHGDEAMTRKYQRHQAVLSAEQAAAVLGAMGLAA